MNKIKNILFAVGIIAFTGLFFSLNISAQSGASEQIQQARCSRITERIDTQIESYNLTKDKYLNIYTSVGDAVSIRLDNLENKGVDVALLRTDLQTLGSLNAEMGSSYDQFIAELTQAKEFGCGTSESEFAQQMQSARQQLLVVRQKALDVKEYIFNTLRPDLRNLKTTI